MKQIRDISMILIYILKYYLVFKFVEFIAFIFHFNMETEKFSVFRFTVILLCIGSILKIGLQYIFQIESSDIKLFRKILYCHRSGKDGESI